MLEYISQFTQPILKTVQTLFLSLAFLSGANPVPTIINNPVQEVDLAPITQQVAQLGANISALADFRTSLSSEITSSATTMTLTSFTSGSDSLTVGKTYGFKLGGREYVIGTASTANTITGMTRGVSRGTGTTTVSAYQSRWGRGTAVEITDAPLLVRVANILGGEQGIENVLKYDSTVGTSTIASDNKNLVNTELLNYTAFNGAGVIDASATQKGLVEIATQIETASSTSAGSTGALLAIPASNATSTYNSATAPLRVVVTQNDGKIDSNFLKSDIVSTSTIANFATSSINIGAFPAYNIGKNIKTITTTGTSTFSVPSGVTKLFVQVVGPGGTGFTTGTNVGGGGGGGGGSSEEFVDVTGTSTIQVYVGVTGTGQWSNFGTNGFYLSATGGSNATSQIGGAGGSGSGGDINTVGEGGGTGSQVSANFSAGGNGGSSRFGGGGIGSFANSGAGVSGGAGGNYGGGGGGGAGGSGSGGSGGSGAQGVVKISW